MFGRGSQDSGAEGCQARGSSRVPQIIVEAVYHERRRRRRRQTILGVIKERVVDSRMCTAGCLLSL